METEQQSSPQATPEVGETEESEAISRSPLLSAACCACASNSLSDIVTADEMHNLRTMHNPITVARRRHRTSRRQKGSESLGSAQSISLPPDARGDAAKQKTLPHWELNPGLLGEDQVF